MRSVAAAAICASALLGLGSSRATTELTASGLIAFEGVTDCTYDDPGETCYQGIGTVNAAGGKARWLTRDATGGTSPAWSPSGRRIAFISDGKKEVGQIRLMNADGSGQKRITRGGSYYSPTWSPSGQRIAVSGGPVGSDLDQDLYVMDADGTDRRRLTGQAEPCCAEDPSWSPDGRSIVFISAASGDSIWLINADGRGLRQLVLSGYQPSWFPDGKRIVFSWSSGRSVGYEVRVINTNGTGLKRLATNAMEPVLSPNGRKIAFLRDDNQIWIMDSDGSNKRHVVTTNLGTVPVTWSPSSRSLAFIRDVGRDVSKYAIYMINSNGTAERRVGVCGCEYPLWQPAPRTP